MTTPKFKTTFDLTLARDGKWPVVSRNGQPRTVLEWDRKGLQPLVVYNPSALAVDLHCANGRYYTDDAENHRDLFLSDNTDDPAVQRAVEAAHEAGEPLSWRMNFGDAWTPVKAPVWHWNGGIYLPTRLLPATPWTAKPVPDGFEIATPQAGNLSDEWMYVWQGYAWCGASNFTYPDHFKGLHEFTFARRKWTMPEPPAGERWHRNDWTAEMLPAVDDDGSPWRPLLLSEMDGEWHTDIEFKCQRHIAAGFQPGQWNAREATGKCDWFRTRRPLPAKLEPVYWSEPGHVPGPVCWLRMKARDGQDRNLQAQVISVSGKGFEWFANSDKFVLWSETSKLEKFEHSTDRVNWKPCTVEGGK